MLGLALGSLLDAVSLGLFAAVSAALVTALMHAHASDDGAQGGTSVVSRVLVGTSPGHAASCAGVVAGMLTAAGELLGPAVWPLALAVALTSPRVWRAGVAYLVSSARTGRCSRMPGCVCGSRRMLQPEDLAGLVRGLSDIELRLAWSESWARLRSAPSPDVTHGVVVVRQVYLAELERRDPDATHQWLTTLASTSVTDPDHWLPRIADDGAA